MKKIISAIVATVITLTVLFSFSGCNESKETEPKGLAIVLSHLRGFPNTSVNSDQGLGLIQSTCESFGHIITVEVSGTPQISGDYKVSKPAAAVNQDKLNQIVRNSVNSLIAECDATRAQTPESDVLASVRLAADYLEGMNNKEKNLLIFSNGLSTTGILSNSEKDWLSSEPETIVEKLESLHQIPSLKNVKVVWIGIGSGAGKQASAPESIKYRLQQHWKAILEAGGAEVVFDNTPIQGEEGDDLPPCGTVEFISDSIDLSEDVTIKYDGDSPVNFLADQAEFISPTDAQQELVKVAEQLKDHKDTKIVIVGTTSSEGNDSFNDDLSLDRAKACLRVLKEHGIDETRVKCVGMGSKPFPFRVDDLDSNGNLIQEMAVKNRAIFIFSADNPTIKDL